MRLILTVFIVSMVLGSRAAVVEAWPLETTSLRGVEIGAAVSTRYKECPKRDGDRGYWEWYEKDYPTELKSVPCFMVTKERAVMENSTVLKIDNLPFVLGMGRAVSVTVVDGKIESISVDFLNAHFEQIRAAMLEKYGKPTRSEEKVFQNGYGRVTPAASLGWQGKAVTLDLDEHRAGDREWGRIVMHSRLYRAKLDDWFARRKAAIKDGL